MKVLFKNENIEKREQENIQNVFWFTLWGLSACSAVYLGPGKCSRLTYSLFSRAGLDLQSGLPGSTKCLYFCQYPTTALPTWISGRERMKLFHD